MYVHTYKYVILHWRHQSGAKFVDYFNKIVDHFIKPKYQESALDVLHAACVMGLLLSLDHGKLRQLCQKVFPKYKKQFPLLVNKKTGKSQSSQQSRSWSWPS